MLGDRVRSLAYLRLCALNLGYQGIVVPQINLIFLQNELAIDVESDIFHQRRLLVAAEDEADGWMLVLQRFPKSETIHF